ncbi:hypothetical protein [uncultured Helicobacter sp.]|uniref:hypothetical protein n=1 Tax=uncultured Helicobacter sp. TaxID=175537 RepID=UPI0026052648|nr:hypothetical protein [uncultured Helicobacter sp.]
MTNKQQIQKLRDNAELAMASYGYFHLIDKKFNHKSKTRKDDFITLHDILDSTYKGYVTSEHTTFINPEKLNGDFSPLQSKNFFERYDLLEHCPNTNSGFSATLFKDLGEFDEKTNTRNAVNKDSQYILSFRGTELSTNKTEEAKVSPKPYNE